MVKQLGYAGLCMVFPYMNTKRFSIFIAKIVHMIRIVFLLTMGILGIFPIQAQQSQDIDTDIIRVMTQPKSAMSDPLIPDFYQEIPDFQAQMKKSQSFQCGMGGRNYHRVRLAAWKMAKATNSKMYRVNSPGLLKKYAKNPTAYLKKLFKHMEGQSTILFFDEADALFDKRTQVSQQRVPAIVDSLAQFSMAHHIPIILKVTDTRGLPVALAQSFILVSLPD